MIKRIVLIAAIALSMAATVAAQSSFPGSLPRGCTNDQVPVWSTSTLTWTCGAGGGGGGLTVGTTTIGSGTSGRILYDNAGVLGESGNLSFNGTTLTADSYLTMATDTGSNAIYATASKGVFETATANSFAITLGNASKDPTHYGAGAFIDNQGVYTVLAGLDKEREMNLFPSDYGDPRWSGGWAFLGDIVDRSGSALYSVGRTENPWAAVYANAITLGKASSATGTALFKGTTSGTVTLSVADAAGTHTIKLPTTDGSNGQFLKTNGSGQWSWADTGLTVGTTAIASGTSTRVLYDNAGVLGEYSVIPVSLGGTNATSASITAFNNITGYTASGATGTTSTNLVFSTSPTITTPTLAGYTASSIVKYTAVTATKTANYTVANDFFVPCDTSGGGFTVTLPAASGVLGQVVWVKLVTAGNTLTIGRTGSDTIDGATTKTTDVAGDTLGFYAAASGVWYIF